LNHPKGITKIHNMTAITSHQKAKALKPGSRRPAKDLCSECGLCDTYYIHYVKEACAFIN